MQELERSRSQSRGCRVPARQCGRPGRIQCRAQARGSQPKCRRREAHGKDCSCNPFAFPPSMAVRCARAANAKHRHLIVDSQSSPPAPGHGEQAGESLHTACAISALESEPTFSPDTCNSLRAVGFAVARKEWVRIQSLVVSDPSPWARQPGITCRPRARRYPSARL